MLQSVNSNSITNTTNRDGQVFEGSNFCYKPDYLRYLVSRFV